MIVPPLLQPAYTGELRNIRLWAFSIERDEAQALLPTPLVVRNFRGRALVSMADVSISKLRVRGFPAQVGLHYRHIVLRLLIDDSRYSRGRQRGAWFMRSFVEHSWLAAAGNALTEFRFSAASLSSGDKQLDVQCGEHRIHCAWEERCPPLSDNALLSEVQTLDRAYSVRNSRVWCRDIQRGSWLPKPLACKNFSCSWFESTRFEGVYTIVQPVSYTWFPPKEVL